MEFRSILVLCHGNICRSPLAAALLDQTLPSSEVASAGLGAVVGSDVDPLMREVAEARGLECPRHEARMFTVEQGRASDLILVIERGQRDHIARAFPEVSGKVMLLGHWIGEAEIPDPHRRDRARYEQACTLLEQACSAWAKKLNPGATG